MKNEFKPKLINHMSEPCGGTMPSTWAINQTSWCRSLSARSWLVNILSIWKNSKKSNRPRDMLNLDAIKELKIVYLTLGIYLIISYKNFIILAIWSICYRNLSLWVKEICYRNFWILEKAAYWVQDKLFTHSVDFLTHTIFCAKLLNSLNPYLEL